MKQIYEIVMVTLRFNKLRSCHSARCTSRHKEKRHPPLRTVYQGAKRVKVAKAQRPKVHSLIHIASRNAGVHGQWGDRRGSQQERPGRSPEMPEKETQGSADCVASKRWSRTG